MDEALAGMVKLHDTMSGALLPSLQQQLMINGAGGEAVKAVLERVIQLFKRKMLGASRIRPVQKRAMLRSIGHAKRIIGG